VDEPWLFDLEKDPDELRNVYNDEDSRPIVRQMAAALRDYGQMHNDLYVKSPKIAGEIEKALG